MILDRDERLAGMATLALTGAWVAESPAEANRLAIQWADAEPRWQYGHTRSVIRPYAERPTWWEVTVVLVPRTTTYRVRDA